MSIAKIRALGASLPVLSALLLVPTLLVALAANAAVTDISNAPLFTSSATAVKPNLMFILDDSGSMGWDFLPDDANFSTTKYGKLSYHCNGVAYNPSVTYSLPVDANGTAAAPASLTFITPNPSTQTSSQRTLSANLAMPTVTSGTMSFTIATNNNNKASGWYGTGDTVSIFQSTTPTTQWFTATVVSWNAGSSTGTLIVDLTGGTIVGSGTMPSPKIGNGQPTGVTYYKYTGAQPDLSYTYTSSGVIKTTTFYLECNSLIGSTPGSNVFTAVNVTNTSTEAQNYANWSVYYRTRMTMMKSSISLAFKGLDSSYRVGYSTIHETTAVEQDDFLNIRDFDTTQKTAFYAAFNAASPGNSTPLRGALSKAGQYYAKKARGQTVDPVQYSCQRNFTILSTDGYWNTGDEVTTSPKFGAYQLDNSTLVGQQDGPPTRAPMLDGMSVTTTSLEVWTTTSVTTTTTMTPQSTVTTKITSGTTTFTPLRGFTKDTFTLPAVTLTVKKIDQPSNTSPFYVFVETNSTNNFTTGQSITVAFTGSGSSPAGYTGTATITVIDSTHFKYPAVSGTQPNKPGKDSDYTVALPSAAGCTAGSGHALRQTQTQDEFTVTSSTLQSTTTTNATLTSVLTQTQKTAYTTTTKITNGVITSTVQANQLLPATSTTTTSLSAVTTVTATGVVTASLPNTTSTWVNSGAATTDAGCVSSKPADTTASQTAAHTSTATTTTIPASGPTGPTAQPPGTPVATAVTPVITESNHVTTSSDSSTGGINDSLADVAAYYYNTDLRTTALSNCTGALGTDVCNNNVPKVTGANVTNAAHSFGDTAQWQHMTTFTLGLGVSGLLKYTADYLTATSGDFFEITNGNKNWPAPGPNQGPENVDDLWHAAVNGRGQYFSAGNPTTLVSSLNSALNSLNAIPGAASAASTSSLQPVAGDNDIYVAKFTSKEWTGDLQSFKILSSGAITTTPTWSAQTQLALQTPASRTIYYPSGPAAARTLKAFTYANLTTDSLNGSFDNFCSKTSAGGAAAPSQCAGMTTATFALANSGANLVSYLRGDQTLTYYRHRNFVLGDIINASPLFVGKPNFQYTTDASYQSFKNGQAASRTAVVLAAANDGMLHAFDRITGNELWAYIPSFVMPNLYKLADESYTNNHSYFVDGSPQMGDIKVGSVWKTIVVGGLAAGGRGYYALDVTNPAAPLPLWEFSDPQLGLTYGNPIITKRADDSTWVVVFASGYNNTVSGGDGNGHLFVLDANTGAPLKTVATFTSGSTPAGTSGTPSGLAKINVWVDDPNDNLARRFYGGDLLGNLWRFDIDNLVAPNQKAMLLATTKLSDGTPQPITVKPALAEIEYPTGSGTKYPVVFVATGEYLGVTDLANTTQQSIYAVKDPMVDAPWGNLRTNSLMVTQTLTIGAGQVRTVSSNAVNWTSQAGWWVDLPGSGERVNVNPQLVLNTLTLGSNVPSSDACTIGGSSFLYRFDITTGSTAAGESSAGTFQGNLLVEGVTIVQPGTDSSPAGGGGAGGGGGGGGAGCIATIVTRSDGTVDSSCKAPAGAAGSLRRSSWRELVD
jgi:type IV pilus assembly protein PilY1